MSDFKSHWDQGEHNQVLANELIEATELKFKDWVGIVSFYSAVHFFEAYFAQKLTYHSIDHKDRNSKIDNYFDRQVRIIYKKFYQNSKTLRYLECKATSAPSINGAWIPDDQAKNWVKRDLETLKQIISAKVCVKYKPYTN